MCVIFAGAGDLNELRFFFERMKPIKGYSTTFHSEAEIEDHKGFLLGFSRAPSENESVSDGDYLQPFEFDRRYFLLFHGVLPNLGESDATFLMKTFYELLEKHQRNIAECIKQIRKMFPCHGAFIGFARDSDSTFTFSCSPSFLPIYLYRTRESCVVCNLTPSELKTAQLEVLLHHSIEPFTTKTFTYSVKSGCLIYRDTSVEVCRQEKREKNSVLISFSGGMDCVATALALSLVGFKRFHAIHFRYGQPEIETVKAKEAWKALSAWLTINHGAQFKPLEVIDLTSLPTLDTSKLKTGLGEGESEMETTARYVPQRNLQFLSLLAAYAESKGIDSIAFGANLTEGMVYPDNSAQFIHLMKELLKISGERKIELYAPLAPFTKSEIVAFCRFYDFKPIEVSWSCYTSEKEPCGNCGSCFSRKVAFERAAQVPERRVREMIRLIEGGFEDEVASVHLACL